MSVIYIVYAPEDRSFIEDRLLPPLPALGFDRWVSSGMLQQNAAAAPSVKLAMEQSAAIVVVVSASALALRTFLDEVKEALACKTMAFTVYLGKPEIALPIPAGLRKIPRVDLPEAMAQFEPRSLAGALSELLPRPEEKPPGELDKAAAPIKWNEKIFSDLLKQAVDHHDFNRSEALVGRFSDHFKQRSGPYDADHAKADLTALRKKRQFLLMRRYASALLDQGATDFQVRRQYAQALIELKEFDHAEELLLPLAEDAAAADEQFEARGLLGRTYKQRYVDHGKQDGGFLQRAIDAYWSVFRDDKKHVWHGINAASCIIRANRDGIEAAPVNEAQAIAKQVLEVLDDAERTKGKLPTFDLATRVEALVDLEDFAQASKALDAYLEDPGMDAFEVSSTYRQFDEVLQLGSDSRGTPLLHRLAKAAERFRTGGLSQIADKGARPMLIRVSDPEWQPDDIPDLVIQSRLGTVLSISASDRTIKALLKDPVVIAIEESRPAGQVETVRSLPFVRVADQYQGPAGSYSERGGEALVAIVDNGIDVLHEAFLDAAGKSRIISIWDQLDGSGPPPDGFKFGKLHTREDIAAYVARTKPVPATLSRYNEGHGTHVASIAAGRRVGNFAGGVAPEAQLLIVISKGDQSTGYSEAHLAALAFIDQTATSVGKPVAVNLSQGMNAGAHDGKSTLEIAFDEFAKGGKKPGRVVVKSAGNERGKRGHSKVPVPQGSADILTWKCPPWSSDVQIELWWRSANRYKFQLQSPSGELSEWVDRKNPTRGAANFQMTLTELHPDNGDNLLKIVVNNSSSRSETDWKLTIEAVAVPEQADIHAWLERGPPPPDGYRPTEFTSHDNEEMTLSIPGTSNSVITVAAIDAAKPIMVGTFSSYGPTRDSREKPDIAAPGVRVKAALRDSGNDVTEMCGTSMAAPHVAGAIALLLSKKARDGGPIPTASQIGAVLRQKTLNYNARWTASQGYGVLDVAALLDAF